MSSRTGHPACLFDAPIRDDLPAVDYVASAVQRLAYVITRPLLDGVTIPEAIAVLDDDLVIDTALLLVAAPQANIDLMRVAQAVTRRDGGFGVDVLRVTIPDEVRRSARNTLVLEGMLAIAFGAGA